MLAPVLRIGDPDALLGMPVVDRAGATVGTVTDVGRAPGRRVTHLLVRRPEGSLLQLDESAVVGFDEGRVLVRGAALAADRAA